MRRTCDAGIEGPHHPAYRTLQLHIHTFGGMVVLVCHIQGTLDGHHVMHRRNDKLSLGDKALANTVMMDQGPTGSLHQAVALSTLWRVGDSGGLPLELLRQDLSGSFQSVGQLNAPCQVE